MKNRFEFIILFCVFLFVNNEAHAGYPGLAFLNESENISVQRYLESEDYFRDLESARDMIKFFKSKLILKSVHLKIVDDPNNFIGGRIDYKAKKISLRITRNPSLCNVTCFRELFDNQLTLLILSESDYEAAH